jgi:hypothetical protein
MRDQRQLGFDELMIVNPSSPGSSGEEIMLLGADGTLYQVQSMSGENIPQGLGQCCVGEDGALYQIQAFDPDDSTEVGESSRYFFGADGMLYEIVQ